DGPDVVERLPVTLVLSHEEVVRQEHGVEVEASQAAPVHGGDGPAMAGHADEARQALLARLDQSLQRAARAHGLVPVARVPKRVQLDHIHVVYPQPVERSVEVLAGLLSLAHAGLGGEEEVLTVAG